MLRATLGIITGLTLAIGAIQPAKAVTGCTNDLLVGAFGLQLTGGTHQFGLHRRGRGRSGARGRRDRSGPGANRRRALAAGYARLVMDGAGGVLGKSAVSIGGAWSEAPVIGSYSVNADCTMSLTLTDSAGGTQRFDGVLARFGDSAMF